MAKYLKTDEYNNLAEYFRDRLLLQLGLQDISRAQLSRLADIRKSTLSAMADKKSPTLPNLYSFLKICRALNVRPDFFFDGLMDWKALSDAQETRTFFAVQGSFDFAQILKLSLLRQSGEEVLYAPFSLPDFVKNKNFLRMEIGNQPEIEQYAEGLRNLDISPYRGVVLIDSSTLNAFLNKRGRYGELDEEAWAYTRRRLDELSLLDTGRAYVGVLDFKDNQVSYVLVISSHEALSYINGGILMVDSKPFCDRARDQFERLKTLATPLADFLRESC